MTHVDPVESSKRDYRAPELRVHGDLRKLTEGGGGTKNEPQGGNPNTRA
jgi:hypothetical protein